MREAQHDQREDRMGHFLVYFPHNNATVVIEEIRLAQKISKQRNINKQKKMAAVKYINTFKQQRGLQSVPSERPQVTIKDVVTTAVEDNELRRNTITCLSIPINDS